MDSLTVSLTFSETINPFSLNASRISIYHKTLTVSLASDDTSLYNSATPTMIDITLSTTTANSIKSVYTIATSADDTSVLAAAAAVQDMAGNGNTIGAANVTSFTPDTT